MTLLRRTSRRPLASTLAAVLVAVQLFAMPLPASAVKLESDFVAGKSVSEAPALKADLPDVSMPSGIITTMDGTELWARNPDAKRAMASTTKIMTALVVLDRKKMDDLVTIPLHGVRMPGESEIGLKQGETYSVRQLLEGMLIHSGNDAAVALAENVAGNIPAFARLMNAKAKELDLKGTQYKNPTGLDEFGHHTTARDLASIARYAMRIPEFRKIVGTPVLRFKTPRGMITYKSSNSLLGKYPGVTGVKTGWTDEAGYCVVESAKRGNIELVVVVMGTSNEQARFRQAKTLLDWGFRHYREKQITSKDETVGAVPVTDYLDLQVPVVVSQTTAVPQLDLAGEVTERIDVDPGVRAPVERGQRLGTMSVVQGGRLLGQVDVVAASDVPAPTIWQRLRFTFVRGWRLLFG